MSSWTSADVMKQHAKFLGRAKKTARKSATAKTVRPSPSVPPHAPQGTPGRSKYKAVRTTVDGMSFHSKREAARYVELKALEKSGLIRALECQPRFVLHVAPFDACDLQQEPATAIGTYVADFRYEEWTGKSVGDRWLHPSSKYWRGVVEDVKGMASLPLAKWKQKHLFLEYGITVQEIR